MLRVYLGAAPGVGKTFAMLSEGLRRAERGTEVVIGALTPKGRLPIIALASRLENCSAAGDLDLAVLLSRRPAVVLVDELAGPPVATGTGDPRWECVDALLHAGCDVVTTLGIGELESLSDVVYGITGHMQAARVPDRFLKSAQIELVDMSPESLRRRLAHGNVFGPAEVDAELADFFRIGNLTALRELALSWVADRVEESLDEYVSAHAIEDPWETRERIVVALGGAPGDDAVVRRAGRLARRMRALLVGVHVVPENGRLSRAGPDLGGHRTVLESLGGTYREIVGDDIAGSLVGFALAERATQLVVGASRRRRVPWRRASLSGQVVRRADHLDVHVIGEGQSGQLRTVHAGANGVRRAVRGQGHRVATRPRRMLSRPRNRGAWLLLVLGLPALTFVLLRLPNHFGVSAVLLLFLAFVLAIAGIGGFVPGVVVALAAFLVSNWFFVPPRHTFSISGTQNVVALLVFVGVAVTVSALVDRVSVRSAEALLARAEAETLARTTATIAGERDPLDHLMAQICSTFDVAGASLIVGIDGAWEAEAAHGHPAPRRPDDGVAIALDETDTAFLVLGSAALTADDHRLLRTIAAQLRLALDARQYQESAARLDALAEANAVRTAMLQAVSHDLRTPLAAIKASASSLLSTEVDWTTSQRDELLTTIDQEADRLNRIVGNLLDMSRLQAGGVRVNRRRTSVEEIVECALASLSGIDSEALVEVDVDDGLHADVDGALVERAIANVVANALSHAPESERVAIEAVAIRGEVHLRVVDRGPGIPVSSRSRLFEPFQRLGDRGGAGVGLGLAVARGLIVATGGRIDLDDTPGGGLTVTLTLPLSISATHPAPPGPPAP